MTPPAITVENLSKAYHIGLKDEIPDTFMGAMTSWARSPLRNWQKLKKLNTFNLDPAAAAGQETGDGIFWALRDVNFEVAEGEVVGIIGRNGAGKSTLLKIVSRITEPTHGRVTIRGRVSSLLEVGTGFHPELTGRENVYMNGTILGMTKREIDRKFDEIVDFSGVEKFLDTPIKRYSSGMKVRLAFAVAAFLEPEILMIDEVLAVGDAEFQKKCLGKMEDVSRGGRTVLFVSHNLAAVSNLCTRGIVLHSGTSQFDGKIERATECYSASFRQTNQGATENIDRFRESWCKKYIESVRIVNGEHDKQSTTFELGSSITIEMTFDCGDGSLRSPVMGLVFHCSGRGAIAGINTRMTGFVADGVRSKRGTIRCTVHRLPFLQGHYQVDVWLGDGPVDVDVVKQFLTFEIAPTDYYGTGRPPDARLGSVFLNASWELKN